MNPLRLVSRTQLSAAGPCCRCGETTQRWDRIAGRPYCPNCEEELVLGEAAPLREPTERRRCAVCDGTGTVRFLTFPLGQTAPVEMDLCPGHLRGVLGRCLPPSEFRRLRRRLHAVGLDVEQVFLLHDAFYDADGYALQPALGVE